MMILQTERLILRTWKITDLAEGFTIWGDPSVMKYIDSGKAKSLEQVKLSIEAGIKHQNSYGFQHWAVIEKHSEKIIGACGFNKTDTKDEIELVFHFAKLFWQKGYGSEAAIGCISYAKAHIKPKRIIAGCHPDNPASARVLTKAGFVFMGNQWFEDTQTHEPYYELVP